jgi:hypothetical protein
MDKLITSISNFVSNLESIRDFVEVFGADMDRQIMEIEEEYSEYVTPVQEGIRETIDNYDEDDDERPNVPTEYEDVVEVESYGEGEINFNIKGEYNAKYDEAMKEIEMFTDRAELLYNGSLMNLTSQVEIFFSDLLHFFYDRYPDALTTDDKIFGLDDLDDYDSISEAKEHYISSRVENIIRGPFGDWIDNIKDFGVSMYRLQESIPDIVEMFERRNLIVHSAGEVGDRYLNKVSSEYTEDVEKGDQIRVTEEYLESRINTAEWTCLIIGLECWKKVKADDPKRAETIDSLTSKYLDEENYVVLKHISSFLKDDENMKMAYQEVERLNYWMCEKRTGNLEEVEEDIKQADFSAMNPRLRLAHASLCGDVDRFFSLVESALNSDEVDLEELKWAPMFKEVRDDDRFDDLLQSHENTS